MPVCFLRPKIIWKASSAERKASREAKSRPQKRPARQHRRSRRGEAGRPLAPHACAVAAALLNRQPPQSELASSSPNRGPRGGDGPTSRHPPGQSRGPLCVKRSARGRSASLRGSELVAGGGAAAAPRRCRLSPAGAASASRSFPEPRRGGAASCGGRSRSGCGGRCGRSVREERRNEGGR